MICASGSVGGARPCQGRGRGFESRLALLGIEGFRFLFFIVKSGLCGLFGNKITGDVLWLLLVTFLGVFNHSEYTWINMKGKVVYVELVYFLK